MTSGALSFSGAVWNLPQPDTEAIATLMRQYDLPEIIARLLYVRGIQADQVPSFLQPTFKNDFPSPFLLQGMEACAQDIAQAIIDKKQFAIFGDFDVDGATSSAVVYRFLQACGIEAQIYIPERLTEGYGPNEQALQSLKDDGAQILLMLDCGTGAYDTIKAGQDMGLQIVIVDHHEAGDALPPAWHVINPKRKDDTSGLDMLAAVGVSFYVCVAVNAKLRERGFYNESRPEPDLRQWLDLVALGTVCDIVPLTHVNRLLVRQGFRRMDGLSNTGIAALAQVSGIAPPFSPYHAGYVLGPRVNAGSRVGQSDLGAKLFTMDVDQQEDAKNTAWTLNDCNAQRKDMQAAMEREAIQMVEDQSLDQGHVIIVAKEGWHSGLTGLVAGRIKEHFKKPACVICIEEGMGKGSGRSIAGVHLGHIFVEAMEQGIVSKGGGHAMAGGFTVPAEGIEAFAAFVQDSVTKQINGELPVIAYDVDTLTTVRGAQNLNTVKMITEQIGPFGAGFEEPLLLFKNVKIHSADIIGNDHIKILITDAEGGSRLKAMAFRSVGTPMGESFLKDTHKAFDILGQVKINRWQDRETVEMFVKDARFSAATLN